MAITVQTQPQGRARATTGTRRARPTPARAPERASGDERSASHVNVTVVERRRTHWCGWIFGFAAVWGIIAGVRRLKRGPLHAEIEHTQVHDDGWTTHMIRVGPWSKETRKFTGPVSYELELVSPDGGLYRVETNISDPIRAAELMDEKLAELREAS
jgi:hypothetical protein